MTIGYFISKTQEQFFDDVRIYATPHFNDILMVFDDPDRIPDKIANLPFYSWSIFTTPVEGSLDDYYMHLAIYLDKP